MSDPFDTEWTDEIVCPFCGEEQDEELRYQYVTLHGNEDGPVECECESCSETFYVKEYVTRNYTSAKTEEDETF